MTQESTQRISRPRIDAACNKPASNACARLAQCDASEVPNPTRAPETIARAINIAPSHEAEQVTGDQPNRTPTLAAGLLAVGSNTHTRPARDRAHPVACSTSGLVDVDTTGPRWQSRVGMITALVFPERGGPSTSTARSGLAARHRPSLPTPR